MRRSALAIVLALVMAAAGACGGSDDGADEAAPDEPTAEEANGSDPTEADEGSGDGEDEVPEASVDLCTLVSSEDVSAAGGVTVTASEPGFGGGSFGDVEYDTRGCNYSDEGGTTEVKVHLLVEPEGGAEAIFTSLQATSADMEMFDAYPHEVLDGPGDGAFLAAGLRSRDLWVLAGDDVVYLKAEADDAQLEPAALQAIAQVAISAVS